MAVRKWKWAHVPPLLLFAAQFAWGLPAVGAYPRAARVWCGPAVLRAGVGAPAAAPPRLATMRLRGGLWYDEEKAAEEELDDEDEYESYYETTEEDEAFDQEAGGGILSQMGRRSFVLPDGRRVDAGEADLPERLGEGMTLEQARDNQDYIPVGTFCNGRFADMADDFLRHARRRWVDGVVPPEDTVPLRRYDVYGLHQYVKTEDEDNAERGRVFLPELDNQNDPRNLLKVPEADLPDVFHMPCGGDPDGGNEYMTMARRFGNWSGPAPRSFSGYVRSPKGRILVHSYAEPTFEDDDEALLNVTDETGPLIPSREALAFFQAATQRNLANGNTQVDYLDGTYEPGPVCWAEDVMCGLSSYSLAQLQAHRRSALRDEVVPSDAKPLLFEAIQSAPHGPIPPPPP